MKQLKLHKAGRAVAKTWSESAGASDLAQAQTGVRCGCCRCVPLRLLSLRLQLCVSLRSWALRLLSLQLLSLRLKSPMSSKVSSAMFIQLYVFCVL